MHASGLKVITSRLTANPQAVRVALRLTEGDEIVYAIEDDRVVISRAKPAAAEDPFATFAEWDSDADRRAYAGL